jgi:hypothetical protein
MAAAKQLISLNLTYQPKTEPDTFDASCACALTLLRSPGKRRNLAQLRRQPNDRRPGRHSEHERPAPEKTTILLASRWISAAEKSIKKAGQHAL